MKTAEAIQLATRMRRHLAKAKLAVHPDLEVTCSLRRLMSSGVVTIHGELNLSHQNIRTKVTAYCRFTLHPDWRNSPPAMRCTEQWIRRPGGRISANWHVNSDDSLCYVLADEWSDQVHQSESRHSTEAAIGTAAFIAANNGRWLLYRHLVGYREKLHDWPDDWPQWPHAEAGVRAYHHQRQWMSRR